MMVPTAVALVWITWAQSPLPSGAEPAHVLRRIHLDFCGRSPTLAEREALEAASDVDEALHEALDRCLASEFWLGRDGGLWRIANPKIRPLQAIKSGAGAGDVPLADYEDDYNLYVYTHSGDRDAREVLTAQYIVDRTDGERTTYARADRGPLEDVQARGAGVAQLVAPDRRCGNLTSRWFLASNTMFTALPRTTAAQAYRAYLGLDIAKLQGLYEVEGEPVDYDDKGVDASACAVCHTALDPLTYPFAYYQGIGGGSPASLPYSYSSNRPTRFTATDGPLVAQTPEAGVILGTPVDDLVQWAQVAADSQAFAAQTVRDFWRRLTGRPEDAEFDELVTRFRTDHDYRVEAMLHDLVMTEAYGVR